MNIFFDNGIIFNIRDFINGSPKFVYSNIIDEINKLPRFHDFFDRTLIFTNEQENRVSFYLNNFQKRHKFVFYGDVSYKIAFNIATGKSLYCSNCNKRILLLPERKQQYIANDLSSLVIEYWYNNNITPKCCI